MGLNNQLLGKAQWTYYVPDLVHDTFSYSGGHAGIWSKVFRHGIQGFHCTVVLRYTHVAPRHGWIHQTSSTSTRSVVVILRVWKVEGCILEDFSIPVSNQDLAQMSFSLWNLPRLRTVESPFSVPQWNVSKSLLSCSSPQFVTFLWSSHLDIEFHASRSQVFIVCGSQPLHTTHHT